MAVDFLSDSLKVANLTELSAIAAVNRRSGSIQIVDAINSASPVYYLTNVLYRYDAASSATAIAPGIITPDDGNGRWIMMTNPIGFVTAAPTEAPPVAGFTWVAFLDAPLRKVIWRSKDDLSTSPTVDDWIANEMPVSIDGVPTFNADFERQRVRDSNTSYDYLAIDTAGSWVLDVAANGIVMGDDVVGDETLAITQLNTKKKLTVNATITLPAGLTANGAIEYLVFDAIAGSSVTLTLTPDAGASLNGGTTDITATNTVARVFNQGSEWFVK